MGSSGLNTKLTTDRSRSRCEICLKLIIKTSKKKLQKHQYRSKQRHVYNTPEKHLNKVLDMLQVVNKKAQSLNRLLRTINRFHMLF